MVILVTPVMTQRLGSMIATPKLVISSKARIAIPKIVMAKNRCACIVYVSLVEIRRGNTAKPMLMTHLRIKDLLF